MRHPERRAALAERAPPQVGEVDGAALEGAVGADPRHRQGGPRELRPQEGEIELGVVRDQDQALQRSADRDGEVREAWGAGDVRVGDAVDVRGPHWTARVEARRPPVDRTPVLVGPDDRELEDALALGIQARRLHVDHREARNTEDSGHLRHGVRRGAAAESIEQSHEDPLRTGMMIARSSQAAGTDESRSAAGTSRTRTGQITINGGRHIDVRRLDLLIANAVLRSS